MKSDAHFKTIVILFEIILLVLFVGGIFLAITLDASIGFVFAYVAGVATIVTPCTLPIMLFSSSQVAGKEYKKGLIGALSFGLGFALVAGVLGALFALTGNIIGLPKIAQFVFAFGGIVAYIYVLSVMGKFHLPHLSIGLPKIKLKGTYAPHFVSGALLSAGDVGCPNPLRFILLAFIISSGSVVTGAWFGFVYGLGAITPILFVTLLSLIGVNVMKSYSKQVETMEKVLIWTLVPVAAFLITFAIFGEAWFEADSNIIHSSWEGVLLKFGLVEAHGEVGWSIAYIAGNITFALLVIFPFIVGFLGKNRNSHD